MECVCVCVCVLLCVGEILQEGASRKKGECNEGVYESECVSVCGGWSWSCVWRKKKCGPINGNKERGKADSRERVGRESKTSGVGE